MANLAEAIDTARAKIMLIGDSGAGKTGSLLSLVEAGYHLRIVDTDNGIRPLAKLVQHNCPDRLGQIDYVAVKDAYKSTSKGVEVVMPAKAYQKATALMDKWDDGTKPIEWPADHIFVVDSLTTLGRAALNQAKTIAPNAREPRQWFYAAQQGLENFIDVLYSEAFSVNVIVITHITEVEMNDGSRRGFPSAIGTALSKHIAKYLNDMFIVETKGVGNNTRRVIRTVPNGQVDAKTSLIGLDRELPIETGLATIFAELRA